MQTGHQNYYEYNIRQFQSLKAMCSYKCLIQKDHKDHRGDNFGKIILQKIQFYLSMV
jgi:hypothetical protein